MLSRLIRHEWKETWRIPVISFLIILILTLVCFFLFRQMEPPADPDAINVGAFVTMMLYCMAVSIISTVLIIYIAVRFYRNLYTDEGYLMHTLPVTPGQLLLSKLLVGALWMFVMSLLAFWAICCILLFGLPAMVNVDMTLLGPAVRELFPTLFGMEPIPFLLFYVLLSLVSSFSSVLTAYAAISLGQLFAKHKVMASILCYIGFTMLVQIVTSILMIPSLTRMILSEAMLEATDTIPAAFGAYMREVFLISMVGSLICAVVSYILSGYIMKKQLNLD